MRKYCNYCGCEQEFTEYVGEQFAELWGNSHAVLRGNSYAVLRENSHAVLWGNSYAVLWGNSYAVLRENSHAALRENSHAVLWENSHAVLWENSHAALWGNSHAVLWENSHAQCRSPYACGILKSITATCIGRRVGDRPITAIEYLASCGIEYGDGTGAVVLYKSVFPDGSSHCDPQTKYVIGQELVCPDWNADPRLECGNGLHLSPTIQQAISFNDSGYYLACEVRISDIAPLPAFAQYPDKIRVRACTPLYRVDKEGNKVEALEAKSD